MKFATLLLLAGLFKQDTTKINYHPFIEITDSQNRTHFYVAKPDTNGSYYCHKHEILEDVKIVKHK